MPAECLEHGSAINMNDIGRVVRNIDHPATGLDNTEH